MRIQRLLGLLSVLGEVEKITIQELADRFEVSKRTIFRDLDMLNCAGIPIVSYPGIGGGVSIMEGYKIDKKVLSSGDTEKIFTALNGLKSIDGDRSVTDLIAKLVPAQESGIFSQSQYVIKFSSWFCDSITQDKAAILHKAISEQHIVHLEYISSSSRGVRIIEPHKLVFRQSSWYLYGFCRERKDFRLFKLSRMVSIEMLEEKFLLRPVYDIELKSNYESDLFSANYKEGLYEVILEYDSSDEFELTQKIDASFFQKNTDPDARQSRIRFYTSNLSWTSELVLGIADKVRVISPPQLYNEIRLRLDKINSFYKGDI
jgi:predicted DNA-binding transcriptional regulator YafY